jgi:hypothetical protein
MPITATFVHYFHLSDGDALVLRSWLGELVWLAPDDLLDDYLALSEHIGAARQFSLNQTQLELLWAYLQSLWDRPAATPDLPAIENIEDQFPDWMK